MNRQAYLAASAVVATLLMGCASPYPLGMDEVQWYQLTPEQQFQARQQQAQLDAAAQQRRAAEAEARRLEAERELAELNLRRQEARYGERVQCIIEQGDAYLSGRWRSLEPTGVDLVQGMVQDFSLSDERGRYAQRWAASFDGIQVRICASRTDLERQRQCATLTATQSQFQRGVTRQVDTDRLLRAQISCDLVPAAAGHHRYRR